MAKTREALHAGRTALSTEQFRSSALFCGGPVDLEFAARQSLWPRTESRYFQTSAEDIHFCEILMTKCIKRIRDLFEYALYKFTLYFTLLTLLTCSNVSVERIRQIVEEQISESRWQPVRSDILAPAGLLVLHFYWRLFWAINYGFLKLNQNWIKFHKTFCTPQTTVTAAEYPVRVWEKWIILFRADDTDAVQTGLESSSRRRPNTTGILQHLVVFCVIYIFWCCGIDSVCKIVICVKLSPGCGSVAFSVKLLHPVLLTWHQLHFSHFFSKVKS